MLLTASPRMNMYRFWVPVTLLLDLLVSLTMVWGLAILFFK